MPNNEEDLRAEAVAAIESLTGILRRLPDEDFRGFLDEVMIGQLLRSLQDPAEVREHQSFAAFFSARKDRLAFVERLRVAIHNSYAFEAKAKDDKTLYLSVSGPQWFEDGVMHCEGDKPHEGFMLLHQGGTIKAAVIARDAKKGDALGRDDFHFIPIDEAQARQKAIPANQVANIEQPLRDLQALLARGENDESKYQELFERYPWILGAEYSQAFRHERLDDRSIPDFLGKRARDGRHDIIEIKRPFEELSRQDGSPNATCMDAMAQCERYLDFARTQAPYCASRNLHFDAPRCTLIAGYDVDPTIQDEFRRKQRVTPGLHILTYNDLVRYVSETIELVKGLRDGALAGEPKIDEQAPISRQVRRQRQRETSKRTRQR
ncbi:MAG: Shedu anti-phage system protein SduA domain-containing protein [Kofleriaceae bacterium]